MIEPALERHDLVEPDRDAGGREIEEGDGDEPEDDVGRSLFRGHSHPLQSYDEQDLREDEVAQRKVFPQGFAALMHRRFLHIMRDSGWRGHGAIDFDMGA